MDPKHDALWFWAVDLLPRQAFCAYKYAYPQTSGGGVGIIKAYYRELHKYKYQLTEDYVHKTKFTGLDITTEYICLDRNGLLHIKKGYCWDGPSGPTFDTKSSMRGSLVHDALYQLMRMGLLPLSNRKDTDKELYQTCLEDGMWKWRAWLWYRTVKKAAGWAAEPGTQQEKKYDKVLWLLIANLGGIVVLLVNAYLGR